MKDIDLSKIKNIHFIGIGGIGISAIARMMLLDGKNVSGQDMQDSEIITDLKNAGALVTVGQSFESIPEGTELVVYTIAIEYYDPELYTKLKEQKNFPIRSYPEMLHVVTASKYTIAIAGTHGKTTTTAMIGYTLRALGKDPSMIVGSLIIDTQIIENPPASPSLRGLRRDSDFQQSAPKTNYWAGKSDLFVVEACEYRRSFLNINPNILVITNIDADHLDYYKDIEDIKSAFRELAMKVPESGFIVCDKNDENIKDVLSGVKAKVVDYKEFFDINLKLKIPGVHNKLNAAGALGALSALGLNIEEAKKSLGEFPGTWRRFEYKGVTYSGTKVYDDYAHHPKEIIACLEGFRELYPKTDGWRIIVVFQPHLFSRTKALLEDFAKSFEDADDVLILPIYYAREVDDGTISAHILGGRIGGKAKGYYTFEDAKKDLLSMNLQNKDIVVTMGAGEAFKIGDTLLNK